MNASVKKALAFALTTLIFIVIVWQYDLFSSKLNSSELNILSLKGLLSDEDMHQLKAAGAPPFKLTVVDNPQDLFHTFLSNPRQFDIVMIYSFQTNLGILNSLIHSNPLNITKKIHPFISNDFLYNSLDPNSNKLFPFAWSSNKYYKVEASATPDKSKNSMNDNDSEDDGEIVLKGKLYFPHVMPLFMVQLDTLQMITKEGFHRENLESIMETLNSLLEKVVFFNSSDDLKDINLNESSVLFLDEGDHAKLADKLRAVHAQTSDVSVLWTLNWSIAETSKNKELAGQWIKHFFSSELGTELAKKLYMSSTLQSSNDNKSLDDFQKARYLKEIHLNKLTIPTDIFQGDLQLSEDLYRHIELYLKKKSDNEPAK